jgi:cytochrome P450
MTIFVAGHETTANALTWTFYLLSQNPAIEEKLHKEVDSILDNGNAIPSVQDIPRLQYTESIFRESLRLFPPIWSIRRNVKTDFRLGEYTIRTGSSIIMSPYVMHHDLRYYKEPERFNPDRWTKEFKNGLPRFSYFPFGGGARSCIGESFAWMEGVLVIAYLAQKWVMRLIPDQIVKLDAGSVLRPKYGIKMKVNLRKRN